MRILLKLSIAVIFLTSCATIKTKSSYDNGIEEYSRSTKKHHIDLLIVKKENPIVKR